MLYTGKGNRFILIILIPILLAAHTAYRIYEWKKCENKNRNATVRATINNIKELDDLNCIILGGSNAFFSLSAEQLGVALNKKCYNLSLLNEGFSDENYWEFVGEALPIERRQKIEWVVFSSLTPMVSGYFSDRENEDKNLIGEDHNFLKLHHSLAGKIKRMIMGGEEEITCPFEDKLYPIPNSFGDFDFNYFNCVINDYTTKAPELDENILAAWLYFQQKKLAEYFPNAKRFVSLPSIYLAENSGLKAEFVKKTKILMELSDRVNKTNEDQYSSLVEEPSVSDQDLICDDIHHMNSKGRTQRTEKLIALIRMH